MIPFENLEGLPIPDICDSTLLAEVLSRLDSTGYHVYVTTGLVAYCSFHSAEPRNDI